MKFAEILCEHVMGEAAGDAAGDMAGDMAGAGGASAAGLLHLLSPAQRTAPGTSAERWLRTRVSHAWDLAEDASARMESDEVALAAACYSLRPPALPIQLVTVAPPEPATPLPASTSPPPPPCTALVAVHLDEERSKNAVRSVLCELMPLLSPQVSSTPGRCSRLPCYARSPRRARSPWFAHSSHRAHHQRHVHFPHTRRSGCASPASTSPPLQRAPNTLHADGHNREEFAIAAAYYSLTPPALPLQLVAVAPPAPPASTTPLPASTSPQPPPCTAVVTVQLDEERSKNAVRNVLCELMPLTSSSTPGQFSPRRARSPWFARSSHRATLQRQGRSTLPHHTRQASPASTSKPLQRAPNTLHADGHNRSILLQDDAALSACTLVSAVSTVGAGNAGSVDIAGNAGSAESVKREWFRSVASQVYNRGKAQRDDCHPDEWLGGVRALRDSHVRLVLRQMRHIERLNHALDRIACPAAPPGTARDAHAPCAPRACRASCTPTLMH